MVSVKYITLDRPLPLLKLIELRLGPQVAFLEGAQVEDLCSFQVPGDSDPALEALAQPHRGVAGRSWLGPGIAGLPIFLERIRISGSLLSEPA